MGHNIKTELYEMPFGKHKGKSFSALPSGYLRWLCGEDWFEEKHEHLFEIAQDELRYRDEVGGHWEDDG